MYTVAMNRWSPPITKLPNARAPVLALGSIEHLQHYFMKTALVMNREYVYPVGKVAAQEYGLSE
jgi:hypothetical protein